MSRNPYATALRYVRRQRIEDKRPNAETKAAMQEADELIAERKRDA